MFSCRSRSAEFQMASFLAEAELQRNFKSKYIVQNYATSNHRLFCVRKQNCRTSRHSIFLVQKRNFFAELQVTEKSLCGGGTAKLQVVLNFCMEAELRNCQATVCSLRGSGTGNFRASSHTPFCMWKRNCGTLSLSVFLVRRRNCGNSSQRIFHVRKQKCRTSSQIIVCVRKWNFKSHNIRYVESLWFLMQEAEVPGIAGPKAPVSTPSWRCCFQLCLLGGGPY